jgi:predicted nuclease of predicted toxin-antitoxin system
VLHATDLGERLSDESIWSRAREAGWIVVTKDADFFDRLVIEGPPPRVVWVRIGNMRRRDLEDRFVAAWSTIESLLGEVDLVELHEDRIEGIAFGGAR